ncbi:MAG: hypothetical protein ACKVRN_14515, partial [Pyrinomonadaceae bacterium]
ACGACGICRVFHTLEYFVRRYPTFRYRFTWGYKYGIGSADFKGRAWLSASHVERDPQKKAASPPTPDN